ncbi:MAG TPA: hypothetical protein PKX48_08910 [Planctomycetota bacterium]|nr:hypothetical protein [Planctomycetota bacterium]OQC20902.1 MAG: hypothetical protein BWX69_01312 [Planctomycetes bacterium ADurb.Bin069]HNR98398.1 hypothetical protein [Planctomycetota bacterium]HNU25182.1 hypothetical protein [Planctomycetota bacterium]HOE30170.1 hypothetical protein [Planctomycetota bacterium]
MKLRRLVLALAAPLLAHAAALPQGPEPAPIALPHFPNRLYAFVWRNWNLVPAERLAAVLGTDRAKVAALAADLGCGRERGKFFGERIALTILRRNWHLLDYPQLLTLLGWTEKELADCLIEHDFFWIKLGSLKPRCGPLAYAEPSPEERAGARRIGERVRFERREHEESGEERFAFLGEFAASPAVPAPAVPAAPRPGEALSIRFLYAYAAVFGDALLAPELDPYPDGYLAQLAAHGVNGVWLHVVLSKLAPGDLFPEEKDAARKRRDNLRALAARARRHGIGVYLYFNEPRSQDDEFFARHGALRGVKEGGLAALCTGTEEVKRYLREGAREVFAAAPDLAGFFTITASENLTHCYSHYGGDACGRCKERGPAAVIAEVNTLLAEGAWEANPAAEAIVWDWGWADHWAEPIIARLPARCRLQSVSEWSVPFTRGGVAGVVGEYSMSVIGPGPRATRHWELAAAHGLRTMAKVQVNNTWELSSVPFIPVPRNVAEHLARLRARNLSGLMLSWSLGGCPSINLRVVAKYTGEDAPSSVDAVLREVAEEAYGREAAPGICEAWRRFSAAFDEFPFHVGVLYAGPQQLGPANLLHREKTGYRATMTGFPYDDLEGWRAIYPAEVFERQFRALGAKWRDGVAAFAEALPRVPAALRPAAERDLGVADAIGLHFESVANQTAFVRAREALAAAKDEAQRRAAAESMCALCDGEIDLARRLYARAVRDARIGFEAANQYFYLPEDLLEKILNAEQIKAALRAAL